MFPTQEYKINIQSKRLGQAFKANESLELSAQDTKKKAKHLR